jgi:hypothetical protein
MERAMATYDDDQVKIWLRAFLIHPELRGKVRTDTSVSYPALHLWDDRLVLDAFYYWVDADEDGKPSVLRIQSRAQIDASNGELIAFASSDKAALFDEMPLELPFQPRLANGYEGAELKATLPAVFAAVATAFVNGQEAEQAGQAFLAGYSRLLPAILMPYYQALNPDFFAWLGGNPAHATK